MIEKPPHTPTPGEWAEILTWAWVIGLSLLGGFVSFVRKVRAGHIRAWNFTEFIGEVVTAALVGIITFHLCKWLDYPQSLTAALVGISSHMGSRALFKLEHLFDAKFPATPPTQKEPEDGQ